MTMPWDTACGREFFLYVLICTMLATIYGGDSFGAVRISEVCPDPATDWSADGVVDTRGDEWVEVVNTGPGTVDLSGYWLRDALGDAPQIRLSGELLSGETALFTGDDALAWQQQSGEGTAGLSLNNSGDTLELFQGHPEQGGTLVDVLIYPAHVGVDDRSLALFLPEGEWILCDGLSPYEGALEPLGTGCSPTPGQPNACAGLVPAERSSMSEVKRDWR